MKTHLCLRTRGLAGLAATVAVLALATGCIYVNHSSEYSGGDLLAVTNLTQKGEIPADLKSLAVDNSFGNVRVTAAEGGSGEWSWTLTVRAQTDALAKEAADAVKFQAARTADQLRLAVSFPATRGSLSLRSDLEIRVPKSVAVQTQNRFGPTAISGLESDVEAAGQNGSVDIRNVRGKVRGETSFATLKVNDTGPATLKGRNGKVEATAIHGPLEAETSFATLSVSDIAGPANLKDQNGSIEAVDVRGPLDAATSFATLAVRDIAGPVKLRDRNGTVRLSNVKGSADVQTSFATLSVDGIEGDATLANQNGTVKARNVTGSIKADTSFGTLDVEAGGTNLVCHNRNGTVRVRAMSSNVQRVEADTSFASLEVWLPAGLKPVVRAHTSFANIESDYPVLLKPTGPNALAEAETAAPSVTLQNQNGRIRIVREDPVASR